MPDQPDKEKENKAAQRGALRADIGAGLSVAVVALPQSMAYAILAGAPPVFGLYTSIVSCIVGAAFGSSRHLVTGPTNATAVIFAATLAQRDGAMELLPAIALYTFLIGLFKFAFGLFRFGRLTNYISDSVIIGFTAGAGILIAGNQLKSFLGVQAEYTPGQGFFPGLLETLRAIETTNPYTLAIALGTVAGVLGLRKLNRRIPGPLLACVGGAALVYLFQLNDAGVAIARDIGGIPRSLPPLSLFAFDLASMQHLASGALAVAVIGLMEATAVTTSIATHSGQRINYDREFMAQGLANMTGAFFSNFASSGSFIRSALNYQSGAQSRWACIFSGLFVAIVLLLLGPFGERIPIAVLAGLLMVAAAQMVNRERLLLAVRAGRESQFVLLATLLATLALRIDWAIYLGIALSLLFFIAQSSRTYITLLVPAREKRFREVKIEEASDAGVKGKVVLINLVGALYFGAASEQVRRIRAITSHGPAAVILRLRRMSSIDSSGLAALKQVHDDLRNDGIPLILCGVDERQYEMLQRARLVELIGPERVVVSHDLMFNSIEEALQLAYRLTGITPLEEAPATAPTQDEDLLPEENGI